MTPRPLPSIDHPLYAPHWRGAAAGRLELQRCEACGFVRWPPRPRCPECLAAGGEWVEVPPTGTIWSHATYEHAYQQAFADEVPYTCALVELDAGPRLVTRLTGFAREPQIGERVVATFVDVAGVTLVYFAPEDA